MEQQISVSELKEYWRQIENVENGSTIGRRCITTIEMPPWDKLCSELGWQLYRADAGHFGKKHHGYSGVYRLIGLETDKPFKPATISRTCGEDVSGTLYIGEAGWLNERLNQLRRSLRREDTHGASRLWRQSAALVAKFPSNKLGVGMLFTNPGMRGWIERDLIGAYLNSFGDTPPLNCSF